MAPILRSVIAQCCGGRSTLFGRKFSSSPSKSIETMGLGRRFALWFLRRGVGFPIGFGIARYMVGDNIPRFEEELREAVQESLDKVEKMLSARKSLLSARKS